MSLDPHECEYVLSPLPSRAECKVLPFPARPRTPERSRELGDTALARALIERAAERRRARLLHVAKWVSLWAALTVGLAVAAVFIRSAWMARGMR